MARSCPCRKTPSSAEGTRPNHWKLADIAQQLEDVGVSGVKVGEAHWGLGPCRWHTTRAHGLCMVLSEMRSIGYCHKCAVHDTAACAVHDTKEQVQDQSNIESVPPVSSSL